VSAPASGRQVLDAAQVAQAVERLAQAIAAAAPDRSRLCVVGVRRGGLALSARLRDQLESRLGPGILKGTLDIGLYRDDVARVHPVVGPTDIPFSIQDKAVVLVDDVLYTGRTVRAALDELMDFGRPRRVYLAVLIDRGGRELPVCADFVGQALEVGAQEKVEVHFRESEGEDAVYVLGRA
jgi:pyrimidine operon attenuation protein/uracil phosphoribosyltransferase